MDSSGFSRLPVGKIVVFAIVGMGVTGVSAISFIVWLIWFAIYHVKVI